MPHRNLLTNESRNFCVFHPNPLRTSSPVRKSSSKQQYNNHTNAPPSTGNQRTMVSRKPKMPTSFRTFSSATFYVLSGCSQPLLVTLLQEAGLVDPKCQFHMLFYYMLPSLVSLPLVLKDRHSCWPSRVSILKACG